MIDTLKGKIRPVQHVLPSVVAISIDQQYTATEPCLGLYQLAQKIEQKPGVLSVSILLGFPYADVPEMGSAFVVVTDDDVSLAERLLKTLELHMVEHHEEFQGPKTSLQEALQQIEKLDKPVLLLDMGDNVGGGSPGDGTFLLHALDTKKNCRSFVCINDPEVVARLMHLSPGQTTEIEIGAKTDNRHGIPFKTPLRLRRVLEGRFSERQARHGGQVNFDMGPTLLGETPHGTTIMVTSRRMVPFSLQQLLHFNVNPLDFDVIVAKGVQAPIAAYSTVCPSIIRVNTAGVTCADMHQFIYHKRRKPLFPFETIK